MTPPPPIHTIDSVVPPDEPPFALSLPLRQKVVLVMDLVESVRLMSANEVAVIDHWRGFVRHATSTVLPRHAGRLVKSLGDGIMAEFDSAREAVSAALILHRHFDTANALLPPDQKLYLRAGLNSTHVYVDDIDIYGSGVNLAARVASLAGPGETMVTPEVRDGLIEGVDVGVEDMGECHLKHVAAPVRAYRVGPPGPRSILAPEREYSAFFQPAIAILPLRSQSAVAGQPAIGELVADGIAEQLIRVPDLRVISQLSARSLSGRDLGVTEVGQLLKANYVLSGSYFNSGVAPTDRLLVTVELADVRSGQIIWAERVSTALADWLAIDGDVGHRIASSVLRAILETECQHVATTPLPSLASYSLLTGAISAMRGTSSREFLVARELLQVLIERHGRNPVGPSWLAKWHVLSAEQGWAESRKQAWQQARDSAQKALDVDPNSSLALTVDGFASCNLSKDFDKAQASYSKALNANPNNSLACLLLGMLHAFKGEGAQAVAAVEKASALSPLDPWRFFYDSLSASAHLSAGNYERAVALARNSLRLNTMHVSTHRALTIALVLSGDVDAARVAAARLCQLDTSLTVASYRANSPGVQFGIGAKFADALKVAGVPAG